MNQTHYEVLGVARTATEDEIKKAYRVLAMKYHPDQAENSGDTDQFIRATQAYESLMDQSRRESYDRILDLDRKLQEEKVRRKAAKRPDPVSVPKIEVVVQPPPGPTPKGPPTKANSEDILKLTSLTARGRYSEAERLARKLVLLNVTSPIPFAVLADISRMRGDLDEASRLYSLAIQQDPKNATYIKKYEDVVNLRSSKVANPAFRGASKDDTNLALFLMVFGVMMAMVYISVAREKPVFQEFAFLSTYTIGLVCMQIIAGLAVGAGLSCGLVIDRPSGSSQIAISVAMLAIFNFWIAAISFLVLSGFRRVMHVTTSRLILGVTVTTLGLATAALVNPSYSFTQVLFWGGNVTFVAAMFGWFMADSLVYPS